MNASDLEAVMRRMRAGLSPRTVGRAAGEGAEAFARALMEVLSERGVEGVLYRVQTSATKGDEPVARDLMAHIFVRALGEDWDVSGPGASERFADKVAQLGGMEVLIDEEPTTDRQIAQMAKFRGGGRDAHLFEQLRDSLAEVMGSELSAAQSKREPWRPRPYPKLRPS